MLREEVAAVDDTKLRGRVVELLKLAGGSVGHGSTVWLLCIYIFSVIVEEASAAVNSCIKCMIWASRGLFGWPLST